VDQLTLAGSARVYSVVIGRCSCRRL